MREWKGGISAGAVGLLLGSVLLTACGDKTPEKKTPPVAEVPAITLKAGSVDVAQEFVGQTESSQQVEIRARVTGYLDKRLYDEGTLVKAGQPLFQIDPKPFQAQLASAKAELAEQQARLGTARSNLKRVKPLAEQDAISKKELDDAIGSESAAAAAVEAAKAKVLQNELDLSYTYITSPVRGLSSFSKQQPGSYINASNSLLTYVAALDPMRVNFSISENEVLKMRSEQEKGELSTPGKSKFVVKIKLADGSIYKHDGHITFSDAAFNESTGSFLIRAEFPNPESTLRPGQFVRVSVSGISRPNAFMVPQRAVQQGPRGTFVWLIKDGKAQQRPVQTGEWAGDNWVIRQGLEDGDVVIIDGFMKLAPDAPAKALPASAAAAAVDAAAPAAPSVAGKTP
ncbi:MAG: efflux RND transporter periplasmic adaptor subunit [Pedobacter sp.]|nr:efflux RND transporter periplasmic adaptor subunit [Pedobacter sp.]